jgi:putative sigma-54 modulation protein
MSVQVTFKNMEHTPALDENIQERTEKIKGFFNKDVNVRWVCWVDAGTHHSEVTITGMAGPAMVASADSDSLYKTFDAVVKKIEAQARKKNDKDHDHKNDPPTWS